MTDRPLARVLIIDDEPLIALSLKDTLVEAGFQIVGVAGKLVKALALIDLAVFDVAIVDANLFGESSRPVGLALAARQIPYLVLSGYSEQQQGANFPTAARYFQKPCDPKRLVEALSVILVNRLHR
jgi:DNA-binding response OmpR family regulator